MTNLNISSRLKVKSDTFFLPDPKGGVYFRNNKCSFRMEGKTIYQWIEKLIPLFNGEHTMGDLTEGLTSPYRKRVYEIGETLNECGFVRDISQDKAHQLKPKILKKYAAQIEFIESFTDSGSYRFQLFRQAKVLAIGSGTILVSMVSSLIEAGLEKCHIITNDSNGEIRRSLNELVLNDSGSGEVVEVEILPYPKAERENEWRNAIKSYDWVLYVSQEGNIPVIRELNKICKEEKKIFLPAVCLEHVGIAGPISDRGSEACFESAWRRIHHTALKKKQEPSTVSQIAGAILANVTVFELFKKVTGIYGAGQNNQFYLLDLETLEGDWVHFLEHPLAAKKHFSPKLIDDLDSRLEMEPEREDISTELLEFFSRITSEKAGVFHLWEEKNLPQIPLAQCYVQAVNILSDGPAELLPQVIAAGLSHEEALKEAGLLGIEMYVSKLFDFHQKGIKEPLGFMGVGAGETASAAICRGMEYFLEQRLNNREIIPNKMSPQLQFGEINDRHCQFYLQVLKTINGMPLFGREEDILGFPVIWMKTNGRKYRKSGLNTTTALRNVLYFALLDLQNHAASGEQPNEEPEVFLRTNQLKLDIPSCEEKTSSQLLRASIKVLQQNNMQLLVYDLAFEPFLTETLGGVFGVLIREEDS